MLPPTPHERQLPGCCGSMSNVHNWGQVALSDFSHEAVGILNAPFYKLEAIRIFRRVTLDQLKLFILALVRIIRQIVTGQSSKGEAVRPEADGLLVQNDTPVRLEPSLLVGFLARALSRRDVGRVGVEAAGQCLR